MSKIQNKQPKFEINKVPTYLMAFLALLSIGFFFAISFFRWQYNDDLVFPVMLQKQSLISFAWHHYLNWDAKFLMPFGLFWFGLVKYLNFNVLLPLASLSFILISFYTVKIVSLSKNIQLSFSNQIVSTAILNGVLFLILYHTHGNLLYWMSGSAYIHALLLVIVWIYYFYKFPKPNFGFYLYTALVATVPQNISLGLFVLVFIEWFVSKEKSLRSTKLYYLIIIFLGIILSTFSPGSFKQLAFMQAETYKSSFASPSIIDYFIHFFKLYIEALKPNLNSLILLAFATVFTSAFLQNKLPNLISIELLRFDFRKDKFKDSILYLLLSYKWLIVSFFCLAIYWPTMLYGYRYYIGFYYFLFLALLLFGFKIVKKTSSVSRPHIFIKFLAPLLLLCLFSVFYYKTLNESILVSDFMKNRVNRLESQRGSNYVEVEALDFSTFTRSIRTNELSTDYNSVLNINYSEYFDIDSIKGFNFLSREELIKKIEK